MWAFRLTKINGPTHESGSWKININQEMYNKFKSPDIATVTEVRTMEWLRHIVRMDGERE